MSGTMHPLSRSPRGAARRLLLPFALVLASPAAVALAGELVPPATAAREGDARPAALQFSRRLAAPQVAPVSLPAPQALPVVASAGGAAAPGPRARPYRSACNFTNGC